MNDYIFIGWLYGLYIRGMIIKEDWNVEINMMNKNVGCKICYCIKSLFVVVKWVVGGSDVVGNVVWW